MMTVRLLTLFSGGFFEIGGLLFIAFLLFGPKKVPEIARTLGKGLGELQAGVGGGALSRDVARHGGREQHAQRGEGELIERLHGWWQMRMGSGPGTAGT